MMIAVATAVVALTAILTIYPSQAAPKAYETSSTQYKALLQVFLEQVNKDVWLASPIPRDGFHRTVKFLYESGKSTATATQCSAAGVTTTGGARTVFDIAAICQANNECALTMKELLNLAATVKLEGKPQAGVYSKCSELKGIYPPVPVNVDKCSAPDN